MNDWSAWNRRDLVQTMLWVTALLQAWRMGVSYYDPYGTGGGWLLGIQAAAVAAVSTGAVIYMLATPAPEGAATESRWSGLVRWARRCGTMSAVALVATLQAVATTLGHMAADHSLARKVVADADWISRHPVAAVSAVSLSLVIEITLVLFAREWGRLAVDSVEVAVPLEARNPYEPWRDVGPEAPAEEAEELHRLPCPHCGYRTDPLPLKQARRQLAGHIGGAHPGVSPRKRQGGTK